MGGPGSGRYNHTKIGPRLPDGRFVSPPHGIVCACGQFHSSSTSRCLRCAMKDVGARLHARAVEARRRVCRMCDQSFSRKANAGDRRIYCSRACAFAGWKIFGKTYTARWCPACHGRTVSHGQICKACRLRARGCTQIVGRVEFFKDRASRRSALRAMQQALSFQWHICPNCSKRFASHRLKAVYCSPACARRMSRKGRYRLGLSRIDRVERNMIAEMVGLLRQFRLN